MPFKAKNSQSLRRLRGKGEDDIQRASPPPASMATAPSTAPGLVQRDFSSQSTSKVLAEARPPASVLPAETHDFTASASHQPLSSSASSLSAPDKSHLLHSSLFVGLVAGLGLGVLLFATLALVLFQRSRRQARSPPERQNESNLSSQPQGILAEAEAAQENAVKANSNWTLVAETQDRTRLPPPPSTTPSCYSQDTDQAETSVARGPERNRSALSLPTTPVPEHRGEMQGRNECKYLQPMVDWVPFSHLSLMLLETSSRSSCIVLQETPCRPCHRTSTTTCRTPSLQRSTCRSEIFTLFRSDLETQQSETSGPRSPTILRGLQFPRGACRTASTRIRIQPSFAEDGMGGSSYGGMAWTLVL